MKEIKMATCEHRYQENKCLCFSSSTSDYDSLALQKTLGHLLPFGKKKLKNHTVIER